MTVSDRTKQVINRLNERFVHETRGGQCLTIEDLRVLQNQTIHEIVSLITSPSDVAAEVAQNPDLLCTTPGPDMLSGKNSLLDLVRGGIRHSLLEATEPCVNRLAASQSAEGGLALHALTDTAKSMLRALCEPGAHPILSKIGVGQAVHALVTSIQEVQVDPEQLYEQGDSICRTFPSISSRYGSQWNEAVSNHRALSEAACRIS